MRRRIRPFFRGLGKFLLGIAVLIAAGLVVLEILFLKTAATLDDELKAARAAGVPIEISDLRRLAYVDPRANAASLYERAMLQASLAKGWLPTGFEKAVGYSYPRISEKERYRLLGEGLPRLKPALDTAGRASKKAGLDWNRRWELGFDLTFPEHSGMKDLAKLISARAKCRAKDGDVDGALDDVETGMRMASHLWREPTLMACFTGVTVERISTAGFAEVLAQPSISRAQLQRAYAVLESATELPNIRDGLAGQLVWTRTMLHTPSQREKIELMPSCNCWGGTPDPPQPPTDPMFWAVRNPPCRKAWEAKAVRYTTAYYRVLTMSDPSYADYTRAEAALAEAMDADWSVENRLNQILFPFVGNFHRTYCMAQAQRRLLLQAAAILIERKKTGKLPLALPVAGKTAIDPFSEKPLRYIRHRQGFKVYSVDSDLVDDNGVTRQDDRENRRPRPTYDLAVSFR